MDTVTKYLISMNSPTPRFSLSPDQAGFGLQSFSILDTIIGDKCPRHQGPPCDPGERWRRHDGSCNNVLNPLWGAANTPFQRTLLPQYSDGVWRPRVAKNGAALPSARLVCIDIDWYGTLSTGSSNLQVPISLFASYF